MPGARCTRGLACKRQQSKTHTSIQVQRKQSGIPCAMVLRLMPRSPRRRIRLVTVAAGLIARRIRLDRFRHRQLGTSNGCRDHAVLPYATTPFVCAPVVRSQAQARPAITLRALRRCVHDIPPRVRDDRDTPLCVGRDAMDMPVIWVSRQEEYFPQKGWTDFWGESPVGQNCGTGIIAVG
jgi:hypothetical protein